MAVLSKILRVGEGRVVKRLSKLADDIVSMEDDYADLTDDQLRAKTEEFKDRIGEIAGLQEFVEFFVSDEIAGPDGRLSAYGLVSDPELAKTQEKVANRVPMGALN